ncbi:MAG: hypothetical protein O3C65_03830 [Proteobacteria bacterium]|nr:hypothetical protein [Pseudomonadota bacterium]MDA1057794.1 hypothetical protein [Pseudomonadota bacterium]
MNRAWIIVGCLVALAACAAPADESVRVAAILHEDRSAAPATAPSSVVVNEARAARSLQVQPPGAVRLTPLAPRPSEIATPRATVSTAPAADPAPAKPVEPVIALLEPARLVGLGRSELADLMGTPELLRNEPPGEVWLYKSDACVAHIYLYEEAGPEDYQVSYVETRSQAIPVSSAQCLAHLAGGSASTVSLNDPKN